MITNQQRDDLIIHYNNLGINKKEIRSYEVSLWTLQDSFITVLKWSDIEQQGRIENPSMHLNVDGTEEFTFSIPMYIRQEGKLVENPNWFNVRNGNIIKNMRKVKVIFNKNTDRKKIFEFIILDVKEIHDNDVLTCEIKCEGLAFHELGKIGYRYSLSADVFLTEFEEWTKSPSSTKPVQNIDYWCRKINLQRLDTSFPPNAHEWYYRVQMNWKSFFSAPDRSQSALYEESFTTAWDDEFNPSQIELYREKERAVEIEQSNIYNITQKIAETFGVFCRYDYLHNDNNEITGRLITFYNNFFSEEEGIVGLTYPYHMNKVSREVDSSNLTTKLYVQDATASDIYDEVYSIMNTTANLSRENYILNFDYLFETGAITQEQYDAIKPFEKRMHVLNERITTLQANLAAYESRIPELEATIKLCETAIDMAEEEAKQKNEMRNALDMKDGDADGYITIADVNPDQCIIIPDNTLQNYIRLESTNKGILPGTIEIYRSFSQADPIPLTDPLTGFKVDLDEYGNAVRITHVPYEIGHNIVYLKYKYNPQLYYDAIVKVWLQKSGQEKLKKQQAEAELTKLDANDQVIGGLYFLRDQATAEIEIALQEKEEELRKFERLMGPAIREGYWTPEDYINRGEQHTFNGSIPTSISYTLNQDTGTDLIIDWDTELFDEENDIYFYRGALENKVPYPCINLSSILGNLDAHHTIDEYSVVWNSNYVEVNESGASTSDINDIRNMTIYSVGSGAIFGYIWNNGLISPALILTGAKNLSDDQLNWLFDFQNKSKPRLCIINHNIISNGFTPDIQDSHSLTDSAYWFPRNMLDIEYKAVYPRMKCSSLALITDPTSFLVTYGTTLLEMYRHYSILTRTVERDNSHFIEYFITIKPEVLGKLGSNKHLTVNYIISNASTAIYLDALKISKENAFPKVSYETSPTLLSEHFSTYLYDKLATIVMINDNDLKLEETYGYISELNLELDNPSQDTVTIKNYTSKFEDLFSSIVASSENLTRAMGLLNAASSGNMTLSGEGLSNTLEFNKSIIDAYLDAHFDTSAVVNAKLESLFKEASEILSDSNKTLNKMRSLTLENASILAGFAENIGNSLSVEVFRQKDMPTKFKVGDVWLETDTHDKVISRYVATMDSENCSDGYGFTKTYNGTYAAIRGASLDVDADNGIVTIQAENTINIESGQSVNIGADGTVNITGNDAVNIGGTQINIGSTTIQKPSGSETVYGGINLVASSYSEVAGKTGSNSLSKVLISPTQIELGGSNILMRGANLIQLVTSRGSSNNTSAIELSPETGVWIGSGQGVRLFSGGFSYDAVTNVLSKTAATGASVELNSSHLILGYSNTVSNSGSAIELDENKIVLATGSAAVGDLNITGTTSGLIGAKFTKNSIGFAVVEGSTVSAILMNGTQGITLGAGSINITQSTSDLRSAGGSYVRLAPTGVDIGSTANLYINTSNFKLQTNPTGNDPNLGANTILAIGTNLNGITSETAISGLPANSNVTFLITKNTAYVKGTLYADTLYIGGKAANISLDNSGKINLSSLNSINLSSYTFDSTGLVGSGVTVTPTKITVNSTGEIDLTGAKITLSAGAIDASKISNLNNGDYYDRVTGITLNSSGVQIDGQKYINLDVTNDQYLHIDQNGLSMRGGSISMTGGNINMTGGNIDLTAGNRLRINGKDVWASDNILYGSEEEVTVMHSEAVSQGYSGPWIWIKPDTTTAVTFVQPSSGNNSYENAVTSTRALNETGGRTLADSSSVTFNYSVTCRVESTDMSWHDGGQHVNLTLYNGDKSRSYTTSKVIDFNINKIQTAEFTFSLNGGGTSMASNLANQGTMYVSASGCADVCRFVVTVSSATGSGSSLCTVYYNRG